MERSRSSRRVVEFAILEARRYLCMEGDLHGFSTSPLPEGWQEEHVHHDHSSADSGSLSSVDTLIVPAYSSRPAAGRKLYLDFNGNGAIDNWGGWWAFGGYDVTTTPAYDIDGDSNSWSNQELANIQRVWKGVAEKFSPFDVDVTTVRPSTINGVQVVIGGDGAWLGRGGGVALVGGWGEEGFTDANSANVAFVWAGQDNTAYVVEAVAHEAGHTLGLYHHSMDPIANNEYVPGYIMGSGHIGIGRWASTAVHGTVATTRDDDGVKSKGSQDDLAKIVSGNGFGYRPDDHGGSLATATFLPLASESGVVQGAANGVIETAADRDFFRVSHTGGSLDIEVLAAEFRRMLDPRMTLRASNNAVISTSTNNSGSDGVGERIKFENLDAGNYYIEIYGSGNYGDIGQFRLHVRAGLATSAFNDTLATATSLGLFGDTGSTALGIGFAGTAIINDSLTPTDNYDFFRFVTPANTRQVYVRLSGQTVSSSVALYDDLNGNGIVEVGEVLFANNPSLSTQAFTHTAAAGGKSYYVRVARNPAAGSGNYQLRISTDTAPASLPVSVPTATFDPQPLVGGRTVYDSIDAPAGDTVDYYRVTAEAAGLFSFYLSIDSDDLRLDVGTDINGNGVLEGGEILATSAIPASSFEFIQELPVTAGQKLLVRITQQASNASSNYTLTAIADYAIGGNTTGSLVGARDLTEMSGGIIYEYLDGSVDFYDTFRIAPPPGPLDAALQTLSGLGHRLQIIRDSNGNQTVDPGEIVATSDFEGVSHNVTAGANYYLRVTTRLIGEFPSIGNYGLVFLTAGATTGSTSDAPTIINPTPTPSSVSGYLSYSWIFLAFQDTDDYYQVTLNTRTRFDVAVSDLPNAGVQIGQLDGNGNFVRLAGVGRNQAVVDSLSVNLDPGTYLVRAFLAVGERESGLVGGDYSLSFKTAAITDDAPPLVTAAAFQYEIKPTGVSFTIDQDVGGSVDAADVVIRNLDTNVVYPVAGTFYDPVSHRIGYTVEGDVLPDGNYRATLLAGSIRDASANPLAADYSFDFFVLAGDANRDGRVNLADFNILAANFGQSPRTFSQGDFNYDRTVNLADFNILAARFGVVVGSDGSLAGRAAGGVGRFADSIISMPQTEDDFLTALTA